MILAGSYKGQHLNNNPYRASSHTVDEGAGIPDDLMALSLTSLRYLNRQSQRLDLLAIAWLLLGCVLIYDTIGLKLITVAQALHYKSYVWLGLCFIIWVAAVGVYFRLTWSRWLSYGLAILLITWPFWWSRVLGIFCVYALTTTAVVFDYPRFNQAQLSAALNLKQNKAHLT